MKLFILLFNVTPPGFLAPNMLAKIYDHAYRTRVPSTQSWLLRHQDWTSSYIVWEQMCTYQDIDATIVRVVKQSLLQHLWYLTEQLLIPAFFYESVVPGLKEVLATQYTSSFVSFNI